MGSLPDSYNMVVNTNHKLIGEILKETDKSRKDNLVKQLTDLALLSQNLLKGEALTDFIKRSVEIIK
jgi:molecular chaperone HtpG